MTTTKHTPTLPVRLQATQGTDIRRARRVIRRLAAFAKAHDMRCDVGHENYGYAQGTPYARVILRCWKKSVTARSLNNTRLRIAARVQP